MNSTSISIQNNPLRTRQDVQDALLRLCEPLKPYYSKGKARLRLGHTGASYPASIAELEGFSRVLWGLVPLAAGGGNTELWELYREGIRNGTDPAHPEYWGSAADYDQRLVEMAAIGYALALAPEQVWTPLSAKEKQHFYCWLDQINHRKLYDCNWLFFLVMVNLGFKRVGLPYKQDQVEQNLQRIDTYYLADGWYSDGPGGHCDYYGPFAIHYYSLFYAAVMEQEDPDRSALYKQRAAQFARHFIYWFAEDGSALPYGRSLAYRFSQAAFWGAMAYAGVEAFPLGVTKGILLRHLRWWLGQPIFHSDGTLSIGYAYPNLVMAENYNSPGSPYWAFKFFLPLALGEKHPFWQAEELPLPALDDHCPQAPPHLVLWRQPKQQHILAFNAGHPGTNEHTHTSAKYEKFVYSNLFGFSVPRAEWGLGQGAYDSMLALSEGDNMYRVKRSVQEHAIEGNVIRMRWHPWANVVVHTWLITGAPWHIRVHAIQSQRSLEAADGGFALGWADANGSVDMLQVTKETQAASAVSSAGASGIRVLYGSGQAELIYPNANTNLLHPRTVIPTLRAQLEAGCHWIATGVYGMPSGGTDECNGWHTPPSVEQDGKTLLIYSGTGTAKSVLYKIAMGEFS